MSFGEFVFGEVPYADHREPEFAGFYAIGTIEHNWEVRLFVSDHNLFFGSGDATWPNTPFAGDLDYALNNFRRSIIGSDLIGEFTTGIGELEIANVDGSYDTLPELHAIDGRAVEVRYGAMTAAWADWPLLFKGVAADWYVDDERIRVQVQDFGFRLDVPLQTNVFAGTGGVEGTADLTGKRRPRCFGRVYEVSPTLVNPQYLLFQVNDGPVQQVVQVYDNGVALTFGEDYTSLPGLLAANCPPGKFITSNAMGYFRIAFDITTESFVTADVLGDRSDDGSYVETAADVIHRIIHLATDLEDDEIDHDSFDALNVLQPAPIGLWADHNDTQMVSEALGQIMRGIGGWCGFNRSGLLEVQRFDLPSGSAVEAFDRTMIISINRERLPPSLRPSPWRWRIGYHKHWTINDTPAGSVSSSRAVGLKEEFRVAESSDQNIKVDHPLARDRELISSLMANLTDAQDEADRLLELYRGEKHFYRMTVGPIGFVIDVGDVIAVRYPRWDLQDWALLRVVEITENSKSNTIEIIGFGPVKIT